MAETPGAILIDVQGTCTDYFSAVHDTVREVGAAKHPNVDWSAFVTAWREGYYEAVKPDSAGRTKWQRGAYRALLDPLLAEWGLTDFSDEEKVALSLAWQVQPPWPDTNAGLARLRERFFVGAFTNADLPGLVATVKAGELPFDVLLSAQMFQAFKPDPRTYLGAAEWFGLPPERMMLVACHHWDLHGAHRVGYQTAFVPRALELGPGGKPDLEPDPSFTINAKDLSDLAEQLGC